MLGKVLVGLLVAAGVFLVYSLFSSGTANAASNTAGNPASGTSGWETYSKGYVGTPVAAPGTTLKTLQQAGIQLGSIKWGSTSKGTTQPIGLKL